MNLRVHGEILGQGAQARDAFRRAVSLLEPLAKRDPINVIKRRELQAALGRAAPR